VKAFKADRALKAVNAVAVILFIICVPLLLLTTNLRLAANETRLYEYGFDKYDAGAATGMDDAELSDFAGRMVAYFNSGDELFDTDLFTQRELLHLKDVKGLIRLALYVQIASGAYIAAYIAISFFRRRGAFWEVFKKYMFWGGGATVALLAVLAFWAATDFDSLFLLFHLVSFSNDLWQLNASDTMLLMFPEGFFYEAALFVAAATIIEAIIISGIVWGTCRLRRKASNKKALASIREDEGAEIET
jgi:integral membrane protein (TIGR01906 family)